MSGNSAAHCMEAVFGTSFYYLEKEHANKVQNVFKILLSDPEKESKLMVTSLFLFTDPEGHVERSCFYPLVKKHLSYR